MESRTVARRHYVDLGTEPEYFVTEMRSEVIDGGNVRIYAYNLKGEEYHLLYTVIVPAAKLINMGRQCLTVGAEAYNLLAFKSEFTEH